MTFPANSRADGTTLVRRAPRSGQHSLELRSSNQKRGFRGYSFTVAGTFALVAALALSSQARVESQGGQGPTVTVANTDENPVPVVGSVDIGDVTGTIQVEQSGLWIVGVTDLPAVQQGGSWEVGITGTPTVNLGASNSVNIGNTAASTVPVEVVSDGGSATPITISDTRSMLENEFRHVMDYTVPAGKLLVIRHVSATAKLPPGQHALFELRVIGSPSHRNARHFESGLTHTEHRDSRSANHYTEI